MKKETQTILKKTSITQRWISKQVGKNFNLIWFDMIFKFGMDQATKIRDQYICTNCKTTPSRVVDSSGQPIYSDQYKFFVHQYSNTLDFTPMREIPDSKLITFIYGGKTHRYYYIEDKYYKCDFSEWIHDFGYVDGRRKKYILYESSAYDEFLKRAITSQEAQELYGDLIYVNKVEHIGTKRAKKLDLDHCEYIYNLDQLRRVKCDQT